MTELNMARRRGILVWEAACERLKNALHAAPHMPTATPEQVVEALRLSHKALDELELAFAPEDATDTGPVGH
ncbi:MAG: hypothetical protein EOP82_08055 [Variovorax sp.]|nr:MAG: hypothetical protein EOP82_08055 [Variovorax sp.]